VNLVTGATGILGSHVVLALLQNNQPVVACRRANSDITQVEKLFSYYTTESRQLFEKIKWVDVEIRDIFSIEEALEGITAVYHCAGFVSFNKADRKKLMEINEKGTRNVVDACLHKKIAALCHVSSIGAIHNLDYLLPLNEDVFWKKSGKESDYAISKYNGEREVWRGIEEGLNAVIVNPGVILSAGFWNQSSSKLFSTAYKGNRFYTNGTTGYIAAEDVARAMIELVSKKLFSNRYILVEGNYTFKYIFTAIQAHLNKPVPSINVPRGVLNFLRITTGFFAVFTRKPPGISKPVVNSAYSTQLLSNVKITSVLSFKFKPIDKVIAVICKHYLNEKANLGEQR
jgi:nucleoside-diphosphate-sugar epimerase